MATLTMIAPTDLEEGKIIQTNHGSGPVNVCVPSSVKQGETFEAIVVGSVTDSVAVPLGNQPVPVTPTKSSSYPGSVTPTATAVSTTTTPNTSVVVHTKQVAAPPNKNKCLAIASMVLGIVGLFIFGIILGPLAIILGAVAHCKIQESPGQYGGKCQANAGVVLGIIDTVGWIILVLLVTSS